MSGDFSAAPSALGYAYQCDIALLEYLRRDDPALDVSVELLDDVAFEGDQIELLQSKYEITPGSLSDASPKLWKTIRVWSETTTARPAALLVLFTTSVAADGSTAALLRDDEHREPSAAHDRLVATARSTRNQDLEPAVKAFLGLADDVRRDLVDRIVIADRQPVIADLDDAYARELRHAAPRDRRPALVTRLREWWLLRAERHLDLVARGGQARIRGQEIEAKIADLRDQLTSENLPIDLEDLAEPTDEEIAEDQRMFVMQLRLIALNNRRIALAVHDHNRAFAQRARWVREDLLVTGELETYERRLVEEWERLFLPETDEPEDMDDKQACACGRDLLRSCEDAAIEPIRPRVTTPYVMRGSLHMLADHRRLGWHPQWVKRLQHLLGEAESEASA
jgi:ABC-3C protein